MRSFLRVSALTFLLVALFLTTVAYAAGPPPYYISDAPIGIGTPDGSGEHPYVTGDPFEAHNICLEVSKKLTEPTATLYYVRVSDKEYYEFTVTKGANNQPGGCKQKGTIQRNAYPPGFGVALTPVMIIGGLVLLGIALLGTAWLLYRWSRSGVRTA